ncbi:MAG TPA: HTTM domain-containing protein [Polyangiaceae bacterium]|nr:HTTM domain-containing protein [Polyangiaceae bacterium]
MSERGRFAPNVRVRPHWYALVFYYGIGLSVAAQFVENLVQGQAKVYSGEFYPWNRFVDWTRLLGPSAYWFFVVAEALLLCAYALRWRVSITAAGLALVLFLDNLGGFSNHRLLMAIEMLLISLVPVPSWGAAPLVEKKQYWNLDLVRWQISLVYFGAAAHKLHLHFLSGGSLHNLFFMLREQGVVSYSETTFAILQDRVFCFALAISTVLVEGALVIGLNAPAWVGWWLPVSASLHIGMASLMPHIWIFTLQMIATLVVFLPDRTPDAPVRLLLERRRRPPAFLSLLVPGAVEVAVDEGAAAGGAWRLQMPDGTLKRGADAWRVLLSLSPLGFAAAETWRALSTVRRLPARASW